MNPRTRTDLLLLAGFCAFLFFFGLGHFGLLGADEPRYAQVAREMLARHDWITPTLGGKPWLEKPVLYYWQAMLSFSIFGVTDWAARIPSAVDAVFMVAAVYMFLRRFRYESPLDGALITASCAGVIGFARAAATDMPLASMFAIAMLAWYAWLESSEKKYLAAFYVFLGLGTLAKGPVAPVLAYVVIVLFVILRRDYRALRSTLWFPGIILFLAVTLPWYVMVELRNPEFFRVFILEHNLARFGSNLYQHKQPFWYYLPVSILALMPWTLFTAAACVQALRTLRADRSQPAPSKNEFTLYLVLWLIVPVAFFSISQSKLPGYILPTIPAGALLVVEYVRRKQADDEPLPLSMLLAHSIAASALLVPAVMINYLLLERRLPWGTAAAVAGAMALVIAAGMFSTLRTVSGLRVLRFVTLVPVVVGMAAVLRIGGPVVDNEQSARPLALQISTMDSRRLPTAVYRVRREVEYGLAFYRDQAISNYDRGEIPAGEHLVVAPQGRQAEIAARLAGRRVSRLGTFAPQHLDFFWVSEPGAPTMH